MANLDEISMMLGEIRSDVKHAVHWFDEHEKRDQERFAQIVARLDTADLTRSVARLERVESEIREVLPMIDNIKKAKWVVIGFVAAIGLAGGAVGGVATHALKLFS